MNIHRLNLTAPPCVLSAEPYDLLIFDADATLRRCTVAGQPCPNKPGEWALIPGVEALRELPWSLSPSIHTGLPPGQRKYFGIASNQSGVSLGHMTREDAWFMLCDLAMQVTGDVDGSCLLAAVIQMCWHTPGSCECRKPMPEMLHRIMKLYGIGPEKTLYVGDWHTDQDAARAAGVSFAWAWDFFGVSKEEWVLLVNGL